MNKPKKTKNADHNNLNYNSKNCWDFYNSKEDKKSIEAYAKKYINFLSTCKTERETISYILEELASLGIKEGISKDTAVFSLYNKALIVFKKGELPLEKGLRLIGAHADTPRLDFKQRPFLEQCKVAQAKTHYYGGIRKYQWLARPLAIHGVVVKEDGTVLKLTLGENSNEPVFTIADLLPHLASFQSELTIAKVFEGEKLNVIMGHKPCQKEEKNKTESENKVKDLLLSLFNQKYGITEEDFYSSELQIVPAGPARFVGIDSGLIGGYGQDDRINVFTGFEAFKNSNKPKYTSCLVLWDKEEIGSEGATGAKSKFFEYAVKKVLNAWENKTMFLDCMLATKAISADVHAAVDPDWQELHEKLNSAYLGHGPCFCKFTGHRGKYDANDANPEYVAWLRNLLNTNNIPWQMAELGKVDAGGGGTVAMHLAQYGMNIIDCGPAVLSMHSPFELSSTVDIYATIKAFSAFYNS